MTSKIESIKDKDQVGQLLSVNASLSSDAQSKILDIVAQSGAILKAHFAFLDCHSTHMLRFNHIGRMHSECDYLASLLVEQAGIDPDAETPLKVLAAESAGMFLGSSVAELCVVNKKNRFKKLVLARCGLVDRRPQVDAGFTLGKINPGNRVVVVSDISRTGASVENMVKIVRRHKATVEVVLLFATCNDAEHEQRMVDLGVNSYRLAELKLETSQKDKCPGCYSGANIEPVSMLI
ncbi:MAG: hypothetical protein A2563_04800 [Candidatus Magasanikbacteria bacterium RIFOXYD1_FULL_40_23]|uniref:Phosphoribosyltransferase domain-containing protein n=1 Tax=Candidatus Magasanikbacteria bacterium RIFOXYD1_FULL_40_23 TaxID=1798705 RepID=A0A1F6PA59_9BACT|nr:MAG: hypothetical protein A2563_04800 [Candidatus Magasanikbacteria bacterium RIFOXYD1_FULL_40_23]